MLNALRKKELFGFYENELTNNILSFWLPRCMDEANGGYFNCYNNAGTRLEGTDKYMWSQGRFVWMFAKLAQLRTETFTHSQRARFLDMARCGEVFLRAHCLIAPDDWRCVFLTDAAGAPKRLADGEGLDRSIYADCFVIAGLARYACAAQEVQAYQFARRLYASARSRVEQNKFQTLPYPLSAGFRAHGIPMIFTNLTAELYRAAQQFEPAACPGLLKVLRECAQSVLCDFTDENHVIHEVVCAAGGFDKTLLGQHANPGHTLEDVWFLLEAADLLGDPAMAQKAASIAKRALEIGWDTKYGGLLHYAAPEGGPPTAPAGSFADEPTVQQVLDGWGDKLWWVHSEALYTTLLLYTRTADASFLNWHDKIFEYTFSRFPNADRETREWVQILRRDGTPQNKTVALPVKDPYHIVRNLALLLELLACPAEPGAQ